MTTRFEASFVTVNLTWLSRKLSVDMKSHMDDSFLELQIQALDRLVVMLIRRPPSRPQDAAEKEDGKAANHD
jgi:hypothetical protein